MKYGTNFVLVEKTLHLDGALPPKLPKVKSQQRPMKKQKLDSPKRSIINYYEACEGDYRLFWDLNHSLAMHAGFWDATTKNLREALMRENEVMAETACISSKDHVLDAGCGIGGSCIFLAKHYGCHVTGITLSAKQVETATKASIKYGINELASFHINDFCETTFPDESFDVVWGLESVCHAVDKNKFIQEAYRLLKPGGRLVVADGFTLQDSYSLTEKNNMSKWLKGWGVESLETMSNFETYLKANHFQQIACKNITKNVLPSSKRLYWISFPAFLFSKIGEILRFRTQIQTNNIVAAYYQYITLKKKLWAYALFSAVKFTDTDLKKGTMGT